MSDAKPVHLGKTPRKNIKKPSDGVLEKQCVLCYKSKGGITVTPFTAISSKKLHDSARTRQEHGETDSERQDDICKDIPDCLDDSKHGYHRKPCYSNFTNISRIQTKAKRKLEADEETVPRKRVKRRVSKETTLFNQSQCIICMKERIYDKSKRLYEYKLYTVLHKETAQSIHDTAKKR